MGSILDLNNAQGRYFDQRKLIIFIDDITESLEHDVERLVESQTFFCVGLNRVIIRQILVLGLPLGRPVRT